MQRCSGGREWGYEGEGYEERYGADAYDECKKRVLSHHRSAEDMVDWLVARAARSSPARATRAATRSMTTGRSMVTA